MLQITASRLNERENQLVASQVYRTSLRPSDSLQRLLAIPHKPTKPPGAFAEHSSQPTCHTARGAPPGALAAASPSLSSHRRAAHPPVASLDSFHQVRRLPHLHMHAHMRAHVHPQSGEAQVKSCQLDLT